MAFVTSSCTRGMKFHSLFDSHARSFVNQHKFSKFHIVSTQHSRSQIFMKFQKINDNSKTEIEIPETNTKNYVEKEVEFYTVRDTLDMTDTDPFAPPLVLLQPLDLLTSPLLLQEEIWLFEETNRRSQRQKDPENEIHRGLFEWMNAFKENFQKAVLFVVVGSIVTVVAVTVSKFVALALLAWLVPVITIALIAQIINS
mmetsp:Transcript_11041/g.19966  ORF Transcript_11041/g.19966 Transcript_11041/m.19966 type:complete len:199 (-) Transcript_11041:662-1258(-)